MTINFEKMAYDLWVAFASKKLSPQKKHSEIRTAQWLSQLSTSPQILYDFSEAIFKPKTLSFNSLSMDKKSILTSFIPVLLREFRGDLTIEQVCHRAGIGSSVTYYFWEEGTRDIPLCRFLEMIHLYNSRLDLFCETLGFPKNLSEYGLPNRDQHFSEMFFKNPWVPTIYLALQFKNPANNVYLLSKKLSLSEDQVNEALEILQNLKLVRKKVDGYEVIKGVFFTPPNLKEGQLKTLNHFWMNQSVQFSNDPDFFKIDQAIVSHESKKKILGWIADLRKKISDEVKITNPETLLHMQWQVHDLLDFKEKL